MSISINLFGVAGFNLRSRRRLGVPAFAGRANPWTRESSDLGIIKTMLKHISYRFFTPLFLDGKLKIENWRLVSVCWKQRLKIGFILYLCLFLTTYVARPYSAHPLPYSVKLHIESQNKSALPLLTENYRTTPNDVPILHSLAMISLLQDNKESTIQYLEKLLSIVYKEPSASFYFDLWWQTQNTIYPKNNIINFLKRMLSLKDISPELAAKCKLALSLFMQNIGNIKTSIELIDELGYIKNWAYIGPFPNDGDTCYNTVYPPENEIDFSQTYDGKVHKVRWYKTLEYTKYGFLDFDNMLSPNEAGCVYTVAALFSDSEKQVILRGSFSDSMKIWINDEQVFEKEIKRDSNYLFEQEDIPVVLKKGWNKLLIKSSDESGEWKLYLRVTNIDGTPIQILSSSSEDNIKDYVATKSTARDFDYKHNSLFYLQKQLLPNPDDIFLLTYVSYLTKYTMSKKEKESVEIIHKAINFYPKYIPFYLVLYYAEDDINKKMQALAEAQKITYDCAVCYILEGKTFQESLMLYNKAEERYNSALKINPYSWTTHYQLFLLYNDIRNFTIESLSELQTLKKISPDNPTIPLLQEKLIKEGKIPGTLDERIQILQNVYETNRNNFNIVSELSQIYLMTDREQSARLMLKDAIENISYPHQVILRLAETFIAAEDFETAIKIFENGLKINPYEPLFYKKIGECYKLLNNDNNAKIAWAKSLEFFPAQPDIQEILDYLNTQGTDFFTKYKPDIQTIMKSNAADTIKDDVSAIYLLDQTVVKLNQDGTYSEIVTSIVKVLNNAGIDNFKEEYMVYDPSREKVTLKKATVYTPDGKTFEGIEEKLSASTSDVGTLYNDEKYNIVKFSGITPGSVIYFEYQKDLTNANIFGDYFGDWFAFADRYPVKKSRYVLIVPTTKEMFFRESQLDTKPQIIYDDKENTKTYIYEMSNIPYIKPESKMPAWFEILPKIEVSTFKDWDTFGKWYWGIVKDQFDTSAELKQKVKELTHNLSTVEEQIRNIYNYIVSDIRYLGLEFGIGGWQPRKALQTFISKYGDCKDKATLMVAMLKEIGIDANLVIIGTRDDFGKRELKLPTLNANHAIVRINLPVENNKIKSIFVDGTAQYYGLTELPFGDQGATVLVMDNEKPIITQIPVSRSEDNINYVTGKLVLYKNGKLSGSVTTMQKGLFAPYYRNRYRLEDKRKKYLEEDLSALGLTNAYVKNTEFRAIEDLNKDVEISLDFEISNFLNITAEQTSFDPFIGIRKNYTSRFGAEEKDRKFPIDMLLPSKTIRDIEIELSDNFEIISLPKNITQENKFLRFEAKIEKTNNIIKIFLEITIKTDRVEAEEYTEFRNLLVELDRLLEEKIIIR